MLHLVALIIPDRHTVADTPSFISFSVLLTVLVAILSLDHRTTHDIGEIIGVLCVSETDLLLVPVGAITTTTEA